MADPKQSKVRHLANHLLIQISAKSGVSINSVRRYIAGQIRRQSVIYRIEAALRESGLERFIVPECTVATETTP